MEGRFSSMTEATDFTDEMTNEIVKEITLEDLTKVLSTTIKGDDLTKQVIFLVTLLTFTEQEQKNVILTGESSVGKTWNIFEILWFYPQERIMRFEGATPKSFIHKKEAIMVDVRTMKPIDYTEKPEKGDSKDKWDAWNDQSRNSAYYLNYANKIIVFPDMPDTRLLKNLRPLLSHDHKVCRYDVTEKKESGLRTKEVLIEGYFTSIFASATTEIDEQEASRHYLLSPSDDFSKITESLGLISRQNSDPEYQKWKDNNPERVKLKTRVDHVLAQGVKKILIPEGLIQGLETWFKEKITTFTRPKAQRDYPRLIALAKAWALLNVSTRKYEDGILWCDTTDIEIAKQIYEPIIKCNELGLTPEEYGIWQMIEPKIGVGLTVEDVHGIFYIAKKRAISDYRLRGIIKNFLRVGLIKSERDGKRTLYSTINGNHTDSSEQGTLDCVSKMGQLKSLQDKMRYVRDFFVPNMDITVEDITSQIGSKIDRDEVEKIVLDLHRIGTISEQRTGVYRLNHV